MTRIMLDIPLWLFALFGCLWVAPAWPWMLYLALFSAVMLGLGLLTYVYYALLGRTPRPTPIQRATGRR